jgi:hypothetical protein
MKRFVIFESWSEPGNSSKGALVMSNELPVEPKDDRDILSILEGELDFLEKGGYGRSVRTPWLASTVFQDSPSCFCFPFHDHNDTCVLMQFVPPEHRGDGLPCHHIPLNEAGATVELLERKGDREEIEDGVKNWLRQRIMKIRQESKETGFSIA